MTRRPRRLFAADAVFEDVAAHPQLHAPAAINLYLRRALHLLPYAGTGVAVPHVVGNAAGGGYEWRAAGAVPRGVTALELDHDPRITRLTAIWDGPLVDDQNIADLQRASIESWLSSTGLLLIPRRCRRGRSRRRSRRCADHICIWEQVTACSQAAPACKGSVWLRCQRTRDSQSSCQAGDGAHGGAIGDEALDRRSRRRGARVLPLPGRALDPPAHHEPKFHFRDSACTHQGHQRPRVSRRRPGDGLQVDRWRADPMAVDQRPPRGLLRARTTFHKGKMLERSVGLMSKTTPAGSSAAIEEVA